MAGWRARRSLVVLVVGALLASLLAVAPSPVDAQEDPGGGAGSGSALRVDVDPVGEVDDGAAVVEGAVHVGGEEVVIDTSAVLVFDVSGSARWDAADCNGDGSVDSMLSCEREAMRVFVEAAAEVGSVGEVAAVAFGSRARTADVDPASGVQVFTAAGADDDESGTSDVLEAIFSMGVGGRFTQFTRTGRTSTATNIGAGIAQACSALSGASYPNHLVVLLSDGESNRPVRAWRTCCRAPTRLMRCSRPSRWDRAWTATPGRVVAGRLRDIAELTDGTCEFVEDPGVLADLLEGLARPELQRLEVSVNGGEPVDVSGSVDVELPVRGPIEVGFAHLVEGLDGPVDEICVTAVGQRGGEALEATTCVEVVSNEAPVADAGGDLVVVEGSLVTLDGSGSFDPDGDPLSFGWSLVSVSGPPVVLSSVTEPQVSFLALDDGEYVLELAVSDGRATSTDRARVTVTNGEPVVEASVGSGAGGGGVTMLSGTFGDPGPVDVHSATVDWGDGSGPVPVEVSNQGTGWGSVYAAHDYAEPGSYAVTLSVTDDDGGVGTVEVGTAEVVAPMAVWATGDDSRSISISGSSSTIRGRAHANGGVRTAGSSHGFDGLLTHAGPLSLAGAHHEFDPEPQQTGPADPPVSVELADYRPGGRAAVAAGADFHDMSQVCGSTWSPDTVLEPGLYWAPCDVHIAGAHVFAGPVTIASEGEVRVTGAGGEFFEPFVDGALFVAGADGCRRGAGGGGRVDVRGSGAGRG
ncbi:MAG: PKD domain-containing protein [Acidimicrobiales bacterium]|nr:PKD domain-containing protein [Acidimicrobiales bacterium]